MTPFVLLYARSRRIPLTLVLLAAVGGAGMLLARTLIPMGDIGDRNYLNVPLLLLIPLAGAVITTVGVHSPFGALDVPAGRRGWAVRAAHVTLLAGFSFAFLLPAAADGAAGAGWAVLARNTLGFTGLCLLPVPWLGARLAWLPATAYGLWVVFEAARDRGSVFAWPAAADFEPRSWVIACCLYGLGLAALRRVAEQRLADPETA